MNPIEINLPDPNDAPLAEAVKAVNPHIEGVFTETEPGVVTITAECD